MVYNKKSDGQKDRRYSSRIFGRNRAGKIFLKKRSPFAFYFVLYVKGRCDDEQ